MPKANDTVIYVCPTCALIMQESNPSVKLKSIYEVVLECDSLPTKKKPLSWVDLKKEKITVQDCWRSRNHPNLQATVREILEKMNASIVELENNFEHSDYCGSSLLQGPSPRYKTLAPNLFKDPIFKPCSFEEQEKILSKHAEQYSKQKQHGEPQRKAERGKSLRLIRHLPQKIPACFSTLDLTGRYFCF